MYYTVSQISDKIGVNETTTRSWLNGFRFDKFRYNRKILVNSEFIETLLDFFMNKKWNDRGKNSKRSVLIRMNMWKGTIKRMEKDNTT